MPHPPPQSVRRLAGDLRQLADVVESAAREGLPIPFAFSTSGSPYVRVSFSATAEEFDAWVAYTDADVDEYVHEGRCWRAAVGATINGLPIQFATSTPAEVPA